MKPHQRKIWWATLLYVSIIKFSFGLEANLYGNLVVTPPECLLNNNQQELVHFGNVLLTRVDGHNYKRNIPFDLTCSSLEKNTLKLTLQGDETSFNSNGALKILENQKLGIAFYINNVRQAINKPVYFNYDDDFPTIDAAPVKNNNADFSDVDGGYFTAFATLKVDYQ